MKCSGFLFPSNRYDKADAQCASALFMQPSARRKSAFYYSQLRQGSRHERRYAISALQASTSSAFSFAESSWVLGVRVDIELDLRLGAGRDGCRPTRRPPARSTARRSWADPRLVTLPSQSVRVSAQIVAHRQHLLARQLLRRILAKVLHDLLHLHHAVLARQGDGNHLLHVVAVGLVDFLKDIVERLALRLSPRGRPPQSAGKRSRRPCRARRWRTGSRSSPQSRRRRCDRPYPGTAESSRRST